MAAKASPSGKRKRGKRGGATRGTTRRKRGGKAATRKSIKRYRMGEAGRAIRAYRADKPKTPSERRHAAAASLSYYAARDGAAAAGSKRAARTMRKNARQSVKMQDRLSGVRARAVVDRRVKAGMRSLR